MSLNLTETELHAVRQWFDSVQDNNEKYLVDTDYRLAEKIYQHLGMRVPYSIKEKLDE